jgi:hypothetical protein
MLNLGLVSDTFRDIQNLTHNLGISIKGDTVVLSSLQVVELKPDLWQYLRSAVDQIESSDSFVELDRDIAEYVDQCKREPDGPDLDDEDEKREKISKEPYALLPGEVSEDELLYYHKEDLPSPLRSWLRITDFYEHKLLNRDTSDWTERLVEDLRNYPQQVGAKHCFVALDGIYAGGVKLRDAQVINSQSPEFSILNRIRAHGNYPEYFEGQYIMYYGVWPSRLQLKEFDHLHTKLVWRDRIGLESLRDQILKSEVATLMLVTPSNVRAPNVFIVPESPFDADDVSFSATEPVPSCSWQLVGDYLDREDYLSHIESITVHEKEKGDFQECCRRLHGILSQPDGGGTSSTVEVPIYLYVQACEADNEVLSFLLFCTSLESLLIGASQSELREKFAARLALLVGASEAERVSLYTEGREIYKLRSDLAHGTRPEESLKPYERISRVGAKNGQSRKPYKHTSRERMRELARQGIIAALTLNAILDGSESELQSEVSSVVGKKVGTWRKVLEGLHDRLFDSKASDAVQNAMRKWWQERVSSAGKTMGVPFLELAE